MKNKTLGLCCLLSAMCIATVSCGGKKNSESGSDTLAVDSVLAVVDELVALPPLEEGEVFLKEKDPFVEIVELKGEHIVEPDTFVFKPQSTRMVLGNDSTLVISNYTGPFLAFRYPEQTYLKTIGKQGNGPDEFSFPELVPSHDAKSALCYLFEMTNGKMYRVDANFQVSFLSTLFPTGDKGWNVTSLQNVGKDEFFCVENGNILNIKVEGDSLKKEKRYNLGLKKKSKTASTGSLAVNPERNRMVYAYKYFKMVKFMDMEGKSVRTLNFQQTGFDDETLRIADGLDSNISHYGRVCPTRDYVYISYSGRTPYAISKDNAAKKYYMYVEQYDWNGNPIQKYKLDHFSISMMVDRKLNRLLLTAYYDDNPFYYYHLGDSGQDKKEQ